MAQKTDDESIIEIIQKMVKEGESEETIYQTLKELGVKTDIAKKLLQQGRENIYAAISGDVIRTVRADSEKERLEIKKFVAEEIRRQTAGTQKQMTAQVIADIQKYEGDMESQRKVFQEQMNENIGKVSFLSEKVKEKLNELGSAVRQVQIDMDELKVRGIGARNKYTSTVLTVLGIAFALIDLYLLMTTFQSTQASVDSIIIMVLLALVSISMLFVSTLI